MLLLIVRCLAVYAGTAATFLFLAHRFVSPLSRRMALVLAAAPLLFTGKATFTGDVYAPIDILYNALPFGAHRQELHVGPDHSPPLGDVVYQEIPWKQAAREALRKGELPLWNPHVLAGEPLLAVQQPAVLHPGTWIGLLLPLPQAWTFEMTLRLFLALLCAHLFLCDLGCSPIASLLGSLGWAFSNYLVFYLGYPLTPAAAPFPLLLLGVRRIARASGRKPLGISVAALLLIVASGHPETLLHAAAGAGLYFLFELSRSPRRERWRSVRTALVAGAIALGLSAVLLLPLAEALPHTVEQWSRSGWYAHQKRSVALEESLSRLVPHAMPYAIGVAGHGDQKEGFLEPTAYAGSLLFPFALAGLFSKNRARWFFLGLGLFGLAVCTRTLAADALAKLPLFDIALNDRLVFLATFSMCALAALGANRLSEGEGAPAFLAGAIASLIGLSWLYVRSRAQMESLTMPPAYMRERFLLQIVPVGAAIAVVAALSRRRRAGAGLVALVVLFAAQRQREAGDLYPTLPSRIFYPTLSVLERIPRGEPYRTVAVGREFIPNAAAIYGLEDVRGYEAMTFRSLFETYPLWCVHQPVWFNRVDDPARPFLSFLNVRWMLMRLDEALPEGWPVLAESDGLRLVENPRVLARAFVPRLVLAESEPKRRLEILSSIHDFAERGVVDEAGGSAGTWVGNGTARVSIATYRSSEIALDVDAREGALVGTSIPGWPGWKATLDGRGLGLIPYNHAFLSFRVPAGRHAVVLRYLPDSFVYGAGISLASLLVCLALARRHRRAGTSPPA